LEQEIMAKRVLPAIAITLLYCASTVFAQALFDITNPGDPVMGTPDDNNWPAAEAPLNTIDGDVATKYLCFKTSFIPDGDTGASGFRVTPSGPKVVVKALNLATANDADARDPIAFALSGSNVSIDGPYTLIAEGTIDELSQGTALARLTWLSTPVLFKNNKAYTHYELMFTELRDRAAANSMQIGEVELLSDGSTAGGASAPNPAADTIDVPRDIVLGWDAGLTAASRNVYFSTRFDDVNDASVNSPLGALASQGQTATSYDAGILNFGQTYYWRIDEVNGAPDRTVFRGDVWNFTVEPKALPVESVTATASGANPGMEPEKTVDGSGLNAMDQHSDQATDMWMTTTADSWIQYDFDKVYKLHELLVWNSNQAIEAFIGFGVKEISVEYSADGETWSALAGVAVLNQATGLTTYEANSAVPLDGIMAKSVKLSVVSAFNSTGQSGLAEVRFMALPVMARAPQPADGSTTAGVDVQVSWRSGREAASHELAFSTDPDTIANGTAPVNTVADAGYDAGVLDYGVNYYWQVTEVNEAAVPATHTSDIWSFTTPRYAPIDDFESYSGDVDAEIYLTWFDGFGGDATLGGSITGHIDSPFVETSIVNNGSQSLPMFFDNNGGFSNIDSATSAPTYSEVVREFNSLDITEGNAGVLAVSFRGDPNNGGDPLYLIVEDSAGKTVTVTHPNPAAIQSSFWLDWLIPLTELNSLRTTNIKAITIGVGYKNGTPAGSEGVLYIDNLRIGTPGANPDIISPGDIVQGIPNDGDWPGGEYPALAIDNDTSTKFLHFKGETEPSGIRVTPSNGASIVTILSLTTANDAAPRDPITFELSGSNGSIDGPYTLITTGDIIDFGQTDAWPRFTPNETEIGFSNSTAYIHYQIVFPTVRDAGAANSMQIAEIELKGALAP
jgi:hypothetical protein